MNLTTSKPGPGRNLVSGAVPDSRGDQSSLKAKATLGASCLFSGVGWDLLLSLVASRNAESLPLRDV